MMNPGVQKPHWRPCSFQNACCTGCRTPSSASPSIVVTCLPSAWTAKTLHDFTASPSIEDGARAALARVTGDVRSGESGHLAQVVDEEQARLDLVLPPPSVDSQRNRLRHGNPPGRKANDGGPMLAFARGKGQADSILPSERICDA